MLERETELIIQTVASRTIGSQESIVLQEVIMADIPRGVKAYLRAEVVRWIERDFDNAPSLRNVNRNATGVQKLTKHFLRGLADNYTFPREEYLTMVDNAVHFLENYLCRPQWTLASFVYQDTTSVGVSDIIAKLDHFADYAYLPTLLERALQSRTDDIIGIEEFKTLLTKIDDQVVRQHSAMELAALAKPIYDFLLLTDTPANIPVPIKPILVFLDDKKMRIMREYIENICQIRNTEELTLNDFAELIEDLYLGQAKARQQAMDVRPRIEELSPSPATREPDTPPAAGDQPTQKNIPLSLTFAGLRNRPDHAAKPQASLPDLNTTISFELRDRLTKNVFMGDSEYYRTIVSALNSLRTWTEASAYLDQLCEINDLDPSTPELKELSKTVRSRFTQEGNA